MTSGLSFYVDPLNAGDNPVVEGDSEGAVSEDPADEEMSEMPKNAAQHSLYLTGVLMSYGGPV